MSELQKKSNALAEVAELLHNSQYYCAVAHSAYYSCLQSMQHILLYSIKILASDFEHGTENKGSHAFIINQTLRYIKSKSYIDHSEIKRKIWELKEKREDADYKDIFIDETESSLSRQLASVILPILKRYES